MYRKQVRRRRAVLLLLVAASLTLLSLYFQEGSSGPLHRIEKVVSTVLGPVEDGASRALKPARDLVNWFGDTFEARGDRDRLERENADLNDRVAELEQTLAERQELSKLVKRAGGAAPPGTRAVTARVIARSPTVWYSTVTIDKGSSDGVRVDDPVIAAAGLAGRISETTASTAQVVLITDSTSSVAARVLPSRATGVVEPSVGDSADLELNFVQKGKEIAEGDFVVTAGFSVDGLSSLFPAGIPIGRVTESSLEEQEAYQRVHLRAAADLRDMDYVSVLVSEGAGK